LDYGIQILVFGAYPKSFMVTDTAAEQVSRAPAVQQLVRRGLHVPHLTKPNLLCSTSIAPEAVLRASL